MWSDTTRVQYDRAGLALPSDLTDAEWAVLEPFLPPASHVGQPGNWQPRRIVEAILYLLRGGLPWRMLSPCFPPVSTVRRWFYLWRDSGLWLALNHTLLLRLGARLLAEKRASGKRRSVRQDRRHLKNKPDWFLALSPSGKVPLLKIGQGDGTEAILFESIVICEYIEESEDGMRLYPSDPLARALQRGWIEFGAATLGGAWQFLNATEHQTADASRAALRKRLQRLEGVLADGPYFSGAAFGMVEAVFAPIFRYFESLDPSVSQPIFDGLPRIITWRRALAARKSVIAAVASDYADRFQAHFRQHQALLAA